MAEFSVEIREITIHPHGNADSLEIAQIDGFQSIVRKGQFKSGDQCIYIPEQAVVPQWILERTGLKENRIRPVRLRGVLSQGICLPIDTYEMEVMNENSDVYDVMPIIIHDGEKYPLEYHKDNSEILGITKYEPPIPIHMQGEVDSYPDKVFKFDVENIKRYPDFFNGLHCVVVTEKLHGTFCAIRLEEGKAFISSKGLVSKGLYFKDNERNANNLYLKTTRSIVESLLSHHIENTIICGEIIGNGVQDLTYDTTPMFRVFDIFTLQGDPWDWESIMKFCRKYELHYTPILYEGLFHNGLLELVNGDSKIASHIREGIVIRAYNPWWDTNIQSHARLKAINDAYLTRKNGTELN